MRNLLATPGPTPLPQEVLNALGQPIIHHRSPPFAEIMADVQMGLKKVFQTKMDVLILTASGTGAMEASLVNLASPGDSILSIEAGKFGERWGELGRAYGLQVITDRYENGEACDVKRVAALLDKHPEIKLVCVQACETSTGVMHPVAELAKLISGLPNTLLIVDAITGLGIFDLPMDALKIDVLIGGSQKGFMLPPGLAFISLSEKAWEAQKKSKLPKYYFDLAVERKSHQKNQNAFTPGINLIVALREALKLMETEGLQNIFARHDRLARATKAAVKALGLELFPKGPLATGLTTVRPPAGMDSEAIVKMMRKEFFVTIAGGQGEMQGKLFRLGHMGYFMDSDLLTMLSALEQVLGKLGYSKFKPGAALEAAQAVIQKA